jgi:hypothetical protein
MSGLAEFKEKTFEKYFGHELARQTNTSFSPDQCDEGFLGFDEAFWIQMDAPIPWLPYMRLSRWRRRLGMSVQEIEKLITRVSKSVPHFKFNLFIQYKRPEFIDHNRGKEWPCWKASYYRFDTTEHQQKLLTALEAKAAGRAAVIYAAAAFWRNDDLWKFMENGTIISNSNTANVALLSTHKRYSYTKAGSFGRGHSEPVEITSKSVPQILETGLKSDAMPFNRHIKSLSRVILELAESDKELASSIDRIRRFNLGDDSEMLEEKSKETFMYAYATVLAFCEIAQISFYAFG